MTREITITPVLNGWVCRVGCQTVVFTEKAIMLARLSDYYSDPNGMEKQFVGNAVNKTMDCDAPQVERNPNIGGNAYAEPVCVPSRPVELRR